MSSDGGAATLHPIERAILKALSSRESVSVEELAKATSLEMDQVRRGIEWLKFKNLISLHESSTFSVSLAPGGEAGAQVGLPERRLVNAIKEGNATMAEILSSGRLKKDETNAAIAAAKRNQWIQFGEGGKMVATDNANKQSLEELLLAKLAQGGVDLAKLSEDEKRGLELLKKRKSARTMSLKKKTRMCKSCLPIPAGPCFQPLTRSRRNAG
jgi:phenylalanyl-tRNA synthetase alpha chain